MMTSAERCVQKKTYSQSDEALKALKEARMTARSPQTLTAYRCNQCRKFHLGNNKALVNA